MNLYVHTAPNRKPLKSLSLRQRVKGTRAEQRKTEFYYLLRKYKRRIKFFVFSYSVLAAAQTLHNDRHFTIETTPTFSKVVDFAEPLALPLLQENDLIIPKQKMTKKYPTYR